MQVRQNAVIRYPGKRKLDLLEKEASDVLGSKYRTYRRHWEESSRDSSYEFPLHLDFELNDICNQSCIMCPRNEETHKNTLYPVNTRTYLSYETFCSAIDEAVEKGLVSINLGAFAEPLIHPRFKELVIYAKNKGVIDIRVITNGLILDQYIDFFVEEQITNLYVSLDAATEETYLKIRGKGYQRVVDNLTNLIALRDSRSQLFPIIRASFVRMKINAHEESDLISQWQSLVDHIDIQPGENLGHSRDELLESQRRYDCISPWQRLSILANGDILPCCSFYGRYLPVGNINTTDISTVWKSKEIKSVRENLINSTENVCEICQRSTLI